MASGVAAAPPAPETGGKRRKRQSKDPSTMYLRDPRRAPVCRKARKFFRGTAGMNRTLELVMGPTKGWRTSAKLSVRGNPPKIGLFAPDSHDVVEMLHSEVHHPSINEMTKALHRAVKALGIRGYNGKDHGGLSYISMVVERASSKVQVAMVFNAKDKDENFAQLQQLQSRLDPALLHSLWLHCNPAERHNNAIFSFDPAAWTQVSGPAVVEEQLFAPEVAAVPRPTLFFPPFVFRQANLSGFARIVEQVRADVAAFGKSALKRPPRVVELYGGVGTIGLHLSDLVHSLECSDENPHNRACFDRSVKTLPAALRPKVTYTPKAAEALSKDGILNSADLLVVDPPRKGLDDAVHAAIHASPTLQRLVYVSCGFKAFQRDFVKLKDNGFHLVRAQGHLLFPGSDHLETLAIFARKI
ncbi:Uncharacterized RNA methyltransferase pc1998 [Durusdinium trenchii]|uniref:Uncharacterized RNA methyltransferase pc1998 n=1 Tax=Durusdinium trenchii TaxID=1381693 RepID=A0ABP0NBY3_9DINO